MLIPVWGRSRKEKAVRLFGPALLLLNLGLLGCGVPLAASELTATAEVGALTRDAAGSASEASSRFAGADPQLTTGIALTGASAVSTVAPLSTSTPNPAITVEPTRTPAVTPSPTVTRSPVVSPSPLASGTVQAVGSGTPLAPEATATIGPTSTPATDPSAAAIALINSYRGANGRPPLVANAALTAASTSYAQLMARTNYFGHTGPDGSIAETRIAAAGYKGRFKGEALAAGQTSADAAAKTWIASPAHNAIISDPNAIEVGVGYAYNAGSSYGHYWVLVTGVP